MNYIYITGASRGIEKSLAEKLLESKENTVFGISRSCTIKHPNYKHFYLDFTDLDEVKNFTFPEHPEAGRIVLINNSGILGDISQVGKMDNDLIIMTFNINIISPVLFTNEFINQYKKSDAIKLIFNTSSGAARYSIASWSTYCSSKAALDMFSKVVENEQLLEDNNIRIFSIAPGIVDTKMQDEIREVKKEHFNDVDRFITYKNDNLLTSPEVVANGYIDIILNPDKYPDTIMDLREL